MLHSLMKTLKFLYGKIETLLGFDARKIQRSRNRKQARHAKS